MGYFDDFTSPVTDFVSSVSDQIKDTRTTLNDAKNIAVGLGIQLPVALANQAGTAGVQALSGLGGYLGNPGSYGQIAGIAGSVAGAGATGGGSSLLSGLGGLLGQGATAQGSPAPAPASYQASSTPSWILPVAIGGGLLVVGVIVLLVMRK